MFKVIAITTLCAVCAVTSSPTVLSSKPPVVTQDLLPPYLPGVTNLSEKSLPATETGKRISSTSGSPYQSYSPLPGTGNLAARSQIEPAKLRGTQNLAEKAIPQDAIARMSQQNRKY